MGNVLHEQNKLLEAVSSLKKAVSIKPNYSEAFNNMGNALQDLGKLEEAIQAYNTACLLYTSPSPRDRSLSRMPSSA